MEGPSLRSVPRKLRENPLVKPCSVITLVAPDAEHGKDQHIQPDQRCHNSITRCDVPQSGDQHDLYRVFNGFRKKTSLPIWTG